MTYEELVEKVKTAGEKMDADKITDHLAIQVNIEGEAEGAFYIEMYRGNVIVQPYEYYDRDVLLICQATQILDIMNGRMDPMAALSDGQIRAEGNAPRLGLLAEIIKKTPARKTAAKKAPAKKTAAAAKKTTTTAKAAAKKAETKTTAAKKTPAKKTAAKRTAKKASK